LKTQFDIALDKRKIHLEQPIKTLGDHDIELRLHPEVHATLKLRVESTTPIEVPVVESRGGRSDAKEGGTRTESRGHKRADREREEKAPESEAKPAKAEKKPRAEKSKKAESAE
jgi:large subunit ribosomal protein L9